MKSLPVFRLFSLFTAFTFIFLAVGVQSALALPPAPVPVSPGSGDSIITPTFSWLAAAGAVKYDVEVGPQSDPNTVSWSGQTYNLTLTPANGAVFTNTALYWRVRGRDSGDLPGAWSSKINFTKYIPAPALVSPADATNIVTPTFEWQAVPGAAYYKLEHSTSPVFLVIDDTLTSYNTRITPNNTIAHGTHYWRVFGVDADGHGGNYSAVRSFTKDIPAPTLLSPTNGHPNIHIPILVWTTVADAAYYKVEISTSSTLVPLEDTYITYNTTVTPVDSIPHGLRYWRVSSVDADGHAGTPSATRTFTKALDAPVLVAPGVNGVVTMPTMSWGVVDGAAYYRVELSAVVEFNPILVTYNTYNLEITPVDVLDTGTYYWRVSGVDAGGHVGSANWRKFTLNAPPAAVDVAPLLISPADTETIATDPTFSWSRMIGAVDYRLKVSQQSDFGVTYENVITDYSSYTPYTAGTYDAYPNGTYYWFVEARNSGGGVIGFSTARSFTKQEPLLLTGPADGVSGLVVDPTFQWSQIVGVKTYRLIVSQQADFGVTYESSITDCTSYTPYEFGTHDAYPNGTYYWKVEGRNSGGSVIVTSAARSFTKTEPLPLIAPADGANGLLVDPTLQWSQIVGAKTYRLVISKSSTLSPAYENIITEYSSFTLYEVGTHDALTNGTYYWQVEARNSAGTVIATSAARSFTKQSTLLLTSPPDGTAGLVYDPNFQWNQIVGAKNYRVRVSLFADFHAYYDSIYSDYNTYTPYTVGTVSTYPDGFYYWRVEAHESGGLIIATSNSWMFSKGLVYKLYLPVAIKGGS